MIGIPSVYQVVPTRMHGMPVMLLFCFEEKKVNVHLVHSSTTVVIFLAKWPRCVFQWTLQMQITGKI